MIRALTYDTAQLDAELRGRTTFPDPRLPPIPPPFFGSSSTRRMTPIPVPLRRNHRSLHRNSASPSGPGIVVTTSNPAKCCACHEICAGAQPTPDDARRRQPTPGRTSDPLASSKVLRLPRNLRRCPADARRRQGVHPTPWQAARCCACHEIWRMYALASSGVGWAPAQISWQRSTLLLAKGSDVRPGVVWRRLGTGADFVAGAALCEPPCAEFMAGTVATL